MPRYLETFEDYVGVSRAPPVSRLGRGEMMAYTHDVACPVCFDAHAVVRTNMTPGQFQQGFQPCWDCQRRGWRITRLTRLQRLWQRVCAALGKDDPYDYPA